MKSRAITSKSLFRVRNQNFGAFFHRTLWANWTLQAPIKQWRCGINWVRRNFIVRRKWASFIIAFRQKNTFLDASCPQCSNLYFINKVCCRALPSPASLKIHFLSVKEMTKKIKLKIFHSSRTFRHHSNISSTNQGISLHASTEISKLSRVTFVLVFFPLLLLFAWKREI